MNGNNVAGSAGIEGRSSGRDEVDATIRAALAEAGLDSQEPREGVFVFDLPGERKLATPCRLSVGDHALALHAFVCRSPDENHEAVYRWLLSRNLRMFAMAYGIDHNGDIYLDARLPLSVVTRTELDRLLGAALTYADESFNTLLELGFASSIRREWQWRVSRGESTRNLEAFRGWLEHDEATPAPPTSG